MVIATLGGDVGGQFHDLEEKRAGAHWTGGEVNARNSLDNLVKIKVFAPETNKARNLVGTATELPQFPDKLVPNDTCIR